jgi:hypothetical protein
LFPLEGKRTSAKTKNVHFGSNKSIDHVKSVKALKATKSPEVVKSLKPTKTALKKTSKKQK